VFWAPTTPTLSRDGNKCGGGVKDLTLPHTLIEMLITLISMKVNLINMQIILINTQIILKCKSITARERDAFRARQREAYFNQTAIFKLVLT